MMKYFLLIISIVLTLFVTAQSTINGTVTDSLGNPLSFSSIIIKENKKGTTANIKGNYSLPVTASEITLICKHVGYKTVERKWMTSQSKEINFVLKEQVYTLKDVVISSSSEDPAYAIIRNAIKKRKTYEKEQQKLSCDVYLKGQLQLRDYPKKFLGETVDFEDGDTAKKKMIFLSESIAHYAKDNSKIKIDVISTKVSGQKDGFGFSSPHIISFYNNIVSVGANVNPRGFISSISDNAIYYYKYKFRGTFYENGKEVSHIQVIPRRTYEPLFSGFINIVENDWNLEGVQLQILKENQMQMLDTLKIEQTYNNDNKSRNIRQQVIYPSGSIFGFKFFGSFLQVFDNLVINPSFPKNYFDNTVLKFQDSSNKKSLAYWDSVRPVPLLKEEITDYKKKDSLEVARQSPHYLDSLDKVNNKITVQRLLLTGQGFENSKNKTSVSFQPLLKSLSSYNTVEGYVLNFSASFNKKFNNRKHFNANTALRYGLSNHHFNANETFRYNFGKKYLNSISVSGGTDVFQFNNNNPIDVFTNTLATLLWTRNYMKIYEAAYSRLNINKSFGGGFTINLDAQYQHRKPLENTTDYYWSHFDNRTFTPNNPSEILSNNIKSHNLLSTTIGIVWQPGCRYVQFPERIISIGSKYPVFGLSVTGGTYDMAKNTVDFSKWQFSIKGNQDFKLFGRMNYHFITGGFINKNNVNIIDYKHFIGNRTAIAADYNTGFQLLPYYTFSNIEKLFFEAHAEYHLNGLLTNKIPLFRKFNWFFVLSGNSLFVNPDKHYYEVAFGIENIFKIIRIDGVEGFSDDGSKTSGIRFSLPLIFGGQRK